MNETTKAEANMSESETTMMLNTQENDNGEGECLCYGNRVLVEGVGYVYPRVLRDINAALTQPAAPCGPELTEAMVRAIESARNTFRQNEVEYRRLAEDRGQLDDRYHAYRDVERNCKEDADALDNLLARSASPCDADTVTVSKYAAEGMLYATQFYRQNQGMYLLGRCLDTAIAEAEAALAAKGGA